MVQSSGQKPIEVVLGRREKRARRDRFLRGRLEVHSARGVRGPERVLLEALAEELEGKVLVVESREGLVALAAAKLFPGAEVHLFQMDAFDLHRSRITLRENDTDTVQLHLGADLPGVETYDWVLLPIARSGDAMLGGELLRQAFRALRPRGKLLASTDNSRDTWLHRQVLEVFGAATIHLRGRRGRAYIARRQAGAAVRERRYGRTFRARLFGREVELETRPGVFSHGELDEGTLTLSEAAQVGEASRVLDLGAGAGALGIGAALAAPGGFAVLVDSSLRAARTAAGNIARNHASNALAVISHDLQALPEGSFDLALANPPYYSDHRITELFLREGLRLLAPGGELLLVTKSAERPGEILGALCGELGTELGTEERRGYTVLRARKESSSTCGPATAPPTEVLLLFARYPEPGVVKTRLIPRLGAEVACHVYRQVAGLTMREVQRLERPGLLRAALIDPPERLEEARRWLPHGWLVLPQAAGDLGDRMGAGFAWAFGQGARRAVAVGTDCPELRAEHLREAFEALQADDAVLGPAVDGGYYLIGLSRPLSGAFEGVAWSTETVLAATEERLRSAAASFRLLEKLRDLDTPEDLEALLPRWGEALGLPSAPAAPPGPPGPAGRGP